MLDAGRSTDGSAGCRQMIGISYNGLCIAVKFTELRQSTERRPDLNAVTCNAVTTDPTETSLWSKPSMLF